MSAVSTETARIIAPATVVEKLGEGVPGMLMILANGESFEHEGIRIEAVPAYNLSEERQGFHPKGPGQRLRGHHRRKTNLHRR